MSQATTLNVTSTPESLLQILERQHSVAGDLVRLAESQATCIAEDRTDRLLDLLAQRQSLIDQFTASQAEMGNLTRGLGERFEGMSEPQRRRIKELVSDISQALARVMQRDAQDQATLKASKRRVADELTSLDAAKQAHNAYRQEPAALNRFADQRG
jgi:hypothetical protein